MISFLVQLLFLLPSFTSGTVSCTPGKQGNADCEKAYRKGSYCLEDEKICSNPFASGCLQSYGKAPRRVCNSDDSLNSDECDRSELEKYYQEIRILSQDWEAGIFSASLMQIVLSELLGVPATIEISKPGGTTNFYDRSLRMSYGNGSYDYSAIETALKYGNCSDVPRNGKDYRSCAHVMPEVWKGQTSILRKLEEQKVIAYSTETGGKSKYWWYLPLFTAEEHPSLMSYLGLSTEYGKDTDPLTRRQQLAELFERPFTWTDFCANFTADNCQNPPYFDQENRTIATRAPNTSTEETSYFSEGLFHGHFAPTDENDCTANPDTCTGHFANVQCDWTTHAWQQAYHLKIPVKGNGQYDAVGGYGYGSMVEILNAANYTKSNILFYWFTPDPTIQKFMGTDSEFLPLVLPPPDTVCLKSRTTIKERCSTNGAEDSSPEGACDAEMDSVQKVFVENLYDNTYKNVNEALQSPAYFALQNIKISELDLEDMYREWYRQNNDMFNYGYREAICKWAADNIDRLNRVVPSSYPRSVVEETYMKPYLFAALGFAVFVMVLIALTAAATHHYRKTKVIRFAQPMFLYLLLVGLLFLVIGALFFAVEPSTFVCNAQNWFVVLGYTLVLVPMIVKVGALNRLFRNAKKMKRVQVERSNLYKKIGISLLLVISFLICWTVFDMPTATENFVLTDNVNDRGGNVVYIGLSCGTSDFSDGSGIWDMVRYIYQFFLLVAAAALAFQSRDVHQEFNESSRLAFVTYNHFFFFVLQLIVWGFQRVKGALNDSLAATLISFILSADAFVALFIYFIPKLVVARRQPTTQQRRTSLSGSRESASTGQFHRDSILRNNGRNSFIARGNLFDVDSEEVCHLEQENARLRKRIELLENIINCQNSDSEEEHNDKHYSDNREGPRGQEVEVPVTDGTVPVIDYILDDDKTSLETSDATQQCKTTMQNDFLHEKRKQDDAFTSKNEMKNVLVGNLNAPSGASTSIEGENSSHLGIVRFAEGDSDHLETPRENEGES
mmetsp:Transcript_5907/g.9296  ORF Transcript_5907/g.9296 Transcript_5907/m.9296 type:complete len:1013 (+) Transcript_5907:46-3084(+)